MGPILRNVGWLVLFGAAAATWFVSRQSAPEPAPPPVVAATPLDYYLLDAELVGVRAGAQIRINAERAVEVPGDASFTFDGVRVEYRAADDGAWVLTAPRAAGPKDASFLVLDAVAQLRRDGGDRPYVITTRGPLHFDAERSVVDSGEGVVYESGRTRIEAAGFRADLKADGALELESLHGQSVR